MHVLGGAPGTGKTTISMALAATGGEIVDDIYGNLPNANWDDLVLATGKNYTHRIYLSKGIYADLTLVFHQGSFQTLAWTYRHTEGLDGEGKGQGEAHDPPQLHG